MKPKRTVLFFLQIPPPVHGSTVVGLQIKNSELVNTNYNCHYINLLTSKKINEIGKFSLGKFSRYLLILAKAVGKVIIHKPDLCYLAINSKGSAFYRDAFVVILLKLFRNKIVYHLHGKGVSTRQENFIDNLLYRLIYKKTNVIMLSPHLYYDIQKYVSEDSVFYCPNGVPDLFKIYRFKVKSDDKETVKILFLSNMIISKGVFELLEACKILHNKGINFKCTFAGDFVSITEDLFRSKVLGLNIQNCVNYAGKKYGKEKELEFLKADIFAFPTYYSNECFPLVLLEAMQHSLPIISTFVGGIPDIVQDNVTGFLITPNKPSELAAKLELLISDKSLREIMGKNGRLRYEQNYTLHHFEENLNNILNNCMSY